MSATQDWLDLVERHLALASSGWSLGVFGALAEFEYDGEEARTAPDSGWPGWITPRGAIAIDPAAAPLPLAYELLSAQADQWRHGLFFCLPAEGLPERPAVLTDLGRDEAALRPEDRGARLFDMGLGRPGLRFCVRTADSELAERLAADCGRSLFAANSRAMAAIKAVSPQRVVTTPLGRIEVYQAIGSTSRGIPTPVGPHTHVLPKLLAGGRSHDANIAVPDGLVPLLALYPAHPCAAGGFDREAHAAFQALLQRYGAPDYRAAKAAALSALLASAPEAVAEPAGRSARAAWRIALRQCAAEGLVSGEGLAAWRARLEPQRGDLSAALPGH